MIRLFAVPILMLLAGLLFMGVGCGMLAGRALGQHPPQARGIIPQCAPVASLKADARWTALMEDGDGDWWVLLRYTSTGRVLVGFFDRSRTSFCYMAEGKTSPES